MATQNNSIDTGRTEMDELQQKAHHELLEASDALSALGFMLAGDLPTKHQEGVGGILELLSAKVLGAAINIEVSNNNTVA